MQTWIHNLVEREPFQLKFMIKIVNFMLTTLLIDNLVAFSDRTLKQVSSTYHWHLFLPRLGARHSCGSTPSFLVDFVHNFPHFLNKFKCLMVFLHLDMIFEIINK